MASLNNFLKRKRLHFKVLKRRVQMFLWRKEEFSLVFPPLKSLKQLLQGHHNPNWGFFSFYCSAVCFLSLAFLSLCLLASIMAEFPHYRISLCWIICDVGLHPLLWADEISWDVLAAGHSHPCCCWRFLNLLMTVAVV